MPTIWKPRLRITKKGVRVQAPRVRIGKKVGINISKSGVSASIRAGHGSFNTKRGLSFGGGSRIQAGGKSVCGFVLPMVLVVPIVVVVTILFT